MHTAITRPPSIVASVPLAAWGITERTDADIQRSLHQGRCAACDLPVKTGYKRRRTCICPSCALSLSWCSKCQRPKPHGSFAKDASQTNGLNRECRACRAKRKRELRPHPTCARRGCQHPVATGRHGTYHRLCAGCMATHAWCSGCRRARLRREFTRGVRLGKRHAGVCRACGQLQRPATGVKAAESMAAHARYAAIRDYVASHPEAGKAAICAALGVSTMQIRNAQEHLGFCIGFGPLKAQAMARYRAVMNLSPAEIAELEGISYNAAITLRRRARKALAAEGGQV